MAHMKDGDILEDVNLASPNIYCTSSVLAFRVM